MIQIIRSAAKGATPALRQLNNTTILAQITDGPFVNGNGLRTYSAKGPSPSQQLFDKVKSQSVNKVSIHKIKVNKVRTQPRRYNKTPEPHFRKNESPKISEHKRSPPRLSNYEFPQNQTANKELTQKQNYIKELTQKQKDNKELSLNQIEVIELSQKQGDGKELTQTQTDNKELTQKKSENKELTQKLGEITELSQKQSEIKELSQKQSEVKELTQKQNDNKELSQKQSEIKEISQKQSDSKELTQKQNDSKGLTQKQSDSKELTQKQSDSKELTQTQSDSKELTQKQHENKELSQKQSENKELSQKQNDKKEFTQKQSQNKELSQKQNDIKELSQKQSENKELSQKQSENRELSQKQSENKELSQKQNDNKELSQKQSENTELSQKQSENKELSQKQNDEVRRTPQLTVTKLSKNLCLITTGGDVTLEEDWSAAVKIVQSSQKPLAVMLPWLNAKPAIVMKYTKFYTDQGFDVVLARVRPWDLLMPVKGSQVIAGELLDFLYKNQSYQPLVVHGFSVGGYLWGEVCVKMKKKGGMYQPIIDRIVGQVWDSVVDVPETPIGVSRAMFPANGPLQYACHKYMNFHMRKFHDVATCHYIRASEMFRTNLVKAPALFLVSNADPIGSAVTNRSLHDHWQAQGIETCWKCWENSPHVGHFRKYPLEYATELNGFLKKLNLLKSPEKLPQDATELLEETIILPQVGPASSQKKSY